MRDLFDVAISSRRQEVYVIDKFNEHVIFTVEFDDIDHPKAMAQLTTEDIKDYLIENYSEELEDLLEGTTKSLIRVTASDISRVIDRFYTDMSVAERQKVLELAREELPSYEWDGLISDLIGGWRND